MPQIGGRRPQLILLSVVIVVVVIVMVIEESTLAAPISGHGLCDQVPLQQIKLFHSEWHK